MSFVPFALMAVIIGYVSFIHYKKSDRVMALRRIEQRLNQIEREKRATEEAQLVPVSATQRLFSRRR